MAIISEIFAPRIDTNNEYVTLHEFKNENGDWVSNGQVIAEAETSKGAEDCLADVDGYIYYTASEGEDIKVGERIAYITDVKEDEAAKAKIAKNGSDSGEYKLTKKAQLLAEKNHVDLSVFSKDQIIRERDIQALLKTPTTIVPTLQNQVIILAGGGHAKMCIEIIRQNRMYEITGITDPTYPQCKDVLGVPIIGTDDILPSYFKKGYRKLINGLGAAQNHSARKTLFLRYKEQDFEFPNLIHPRAIVEPSVKMGEGNQIMAGAIIGPDVVIGSNCIVNSGAIVSHDTVISDHVHVAPGAVLAGSVKVGENTLIGMGVTVYFGVTIGKNVTIYNGCNIMSDVPDGAVITK